MRYSSRNKRKYVILKSQKRKGIKKMKVAFDIVMDSHERKVVENFINCLNEYCDTMKNCSVCKFDAIRPTGGVCPIDSGWIYDLLKED